MLEQPKSIQLNDVLITEELSRRSPRQPNLHAENQAMRSLARQLAQTPERMLQHLVDLAVELCNAGTAGVSLVETQPDGEVGFRWVAMAGLLASYVGGCTPRNFSPCGVCLEQGASVLFAYPERYFTYLQTVNTPLVEGLVLPLIADGQALGTIWIVTHNEQRQFDVEDVRLMTGLADFTATLLRSQPQARELLVVGTALKEEVTERKLAEEWAQALIDNLPGGAAFVVDLDLRYLLAAGEALEIAGFETNDFIIGHTIFEVLPPELAASYEPLYRQALAGESFEHEHQSHDRWYVSRGTPLLAEDGEIYAVLVVSYDNTNRKKTEEALRESHTRFRQIFDNNMVAMGIWTPAGAITDANDALLDLIGYTRTDFEAGAIRWNELTPPEYHARDQQAVAEVKAKGACIPYEKEFIHKDGHRQPILIGSGRFDDHTGTGIFCAFDISDRKQAEATIAANLRDTRLLHDLAMQQAGNQGQDLFQSILDTAIALMHSDMGSLQILDRDRNELQLQAWRGFHPDAAAFWQTVGVDGHGSCSVALHQGERVIEADVETCDFLPGTADLDYFHLCGIKAVQSTPLLSHGGQLVGMISTHWCEPHHSSERELRFLDLLARQAADLIEQRRAELERRKLLEREQTAREAAEKANRIKDEFLAILSHELRSPLNPILGWSNLLQSKPFDPATIGQALSTIERNAKLQTKLIDDLLDVARILQGKLKLEETTVNLATVIEAALEVVKTAAQAKSIALQFNLAEACFVRGDEGRLQQVVWNLLSNAIKFTPKGGQVGVRLETWNGQARITVTDTGQGISPDFMPYLFQSFRQEDSSISRRYGGLGLGLAIVKYLVDAHGGSITAASPGVGQGATFTVQLPLKELASAPPIASTSPNVDLTGLKVLAVDDSEDTRTFLSTLLSAYGAQTCIVASGAEVLTNLATFAPDILICDIGMPDMDGYVLLQQIRALPEAHGGNIPAIAVTAFAREEDRQRALDQGFQQHVAKPVEIEQLVSAIAQLAIR